MSTKAQRGLVLLVLAGIGLLVLLANSLNDGPVNVTRVASAVAFVVGGSGLVLLVWGRLRN